MPERGTLLWDFWRSWVNHRVQDYRLFVLPPAPPQPGESVEPSYDYGSRPFSFRQYGVLLECPRAYALAIMRGTTATFCLGGPDKDIFTFPNVNSRWMFVDDLAELSALHPDKKPPQGMALVADVCGGRPLAIPPCQSFHVRLDFRQGALDAVWAAQQRREKIRITYLVWGVFGG